MQTAAAQRRDDRAPPPGRADDADAADIAALRERIAELHAERARVGRALPPERDAVALIEHQVAALADTLPPVTASNLDTLLRMKPGAVLARLFPEAVARAIAEGVHARYAAPGVTPLTQAAKAKELARIAALLHEAAIAEETAIRFAEARGEEVDRRADADPAVLLMEEIE